MTLRRTIMLSATLAASLLPFGAQAADVNMVLNWVPTADHSPYYYAKSQGFPVVEVSLWESDSSCATYRADQHGYNR